MSHRKKIIHIRGMHCRSCELVLEDKVGKVEGISKVVGDHKSSTLEIEYKQEPDFLLVEKAVIASGYLLGKEGERGFLSKNSADYRDLFASAIVLFGLYFFLKTFGVFNLNFDFNTSAGLFGVLLVGLTAGVSTCMALIGGLVLGISSRHAELHPEATPAQKFKPHIFFNGGRLLSYILLGGVIGWMGSVLKLSVGVTGFLTIVIGFVMLFVGLKLTEIFPWLQNTSLGLPKSISRFFGAGKEIREYSHSGAFITGFLTFFLPCGFTQAVQLYAISTGSFLQGAITMGVFALGTLPGIIGIGGLTSWVKGRFAKLFFKFAGLAVVLLALFNIYSGYNLLGWKIFAENPSGVSQKETQIELENGKQVLNMTQKANGYSPNKLTVKVGIPVIWKINSTTSYTCAAYVHMPSMNISQPLAEGMNIIEFTPTEVGTYKFTCSMGMYSGVIQVIN